MWHISPFWLYLYFFKFLINYHKIFSYLICSGTFGLFYNLIHFLKFKPPSTIIFFIIQNKINQWILFNFFWENKWMNLNLYFRKRKKKNTRGMGNIVNKFNYPFEESPTNRAWKEMRSLCQCQVWTKENGRKSLPNCAVNWRRLHTWRMTDDIGK